MLKASSGRNGTTYSDLHRNLVVSPCGSLRRDLKQRFCASEYDHFNESATSCRDGRSIRPGYKWELPVLGIDEGVDVITGLPNGG